jgi:3-hydroxyisobutyrate dehydrogenase-like beta-hydroxyacid dehydrogenase
MRVSVLGLGTMGQAVAGRLLARGHTVTVWNRTPGRQHPLADHGARVAGSVADAVAGAEVVLTLLTADDAVREVCLGDGGVRESLAADAVLVDMSSVHPGTSHEVAAAVGEDRFADAPILAGPATVTSGEAMLVVGGTESVVARLRPLLGDLSARCIHGGPVGAGTTVKLVFNLLFLQELLALSEAVALAEAAGLDAPLISELFRTSAMVPAGLLNRLDDVLGGEHHGWFPIPLARKDLRLAIQLGRESGLDLRLAVATDRVYQLAGDLARPDDDVAAVVEAVRSTRPSGRPRP